MKIFPDIAFYQSKADSGYQQQY